MGTLLSSIPQPAWWRNDEHSWEKSFQQGLLTAAAERQRGTKGSSGSSAQNLILSYKTSEGILGGTFSGDVNAQNANNIGQSQPSSSGNNASTSRVPIPPNNRNRNSESTIRSRKVVDDNENPTVNRNRESNQASSVLGKHGIEKQSSESSVRITAEKSFQPEQWPTLQTIHEQLSKTEGNPSTIIFARFRPNRPSSGFVEILYSICEETNEIIFESSDKLDTLVAPKDGFRMGTTKEDEIKYFMLIFKTCINSLQGNIWWNGFSIVLDQQNNRNRLKVSAFEIQPSQLLFELVNMKDLEVHRTIHRVDLTGKIDGTNVDNKYIRFRGVSTHDIKVNQLRGNLITVHLPRFDQKYIKY